ncbi:MAG: ATP-binding protein [Candidatus Vogelbacteria bacterium]|nr:ATP-binding protein [Candidatus Vogelbacteria bacterium]
MPETIETATRGQMPVGFHTGNIIMYLAEKYGTLTQVIKELVQNQIDARAKRARIVLNCKQRKLQAYDDGVGASIGQMQERIARLGARMKSIDDIGEKGIGNLAGIGIGDQYRLITRPRDEKPRPRFFRLCLDRQAVKAQAEVNFDYEVLDYGFTFSGENAGMSTFVDIQQLEPTALKILRRDDNPAKTIAEEITAAYSSKIQQTGIHIRVTVIDHDGIEKTVSVEPIEFPGRREEVLIETPRGTVCFIIYLTHRVNKNPIVLIDHQGRYSFPLRQLEESWSDVADFFDSGHVQGRIRVDFCTLTGDRKRFEYNSDLERFHEAVCQFAEHYGRPWLARLREQFKAERLSALAERVIQNLERTILASHRDLYREMLRGVGLDPSTGQIEAVGVPKNQRRKTNEVPPLTAPAPQPTGSNPPPDKTRTPRTPSVTKSGVESSQSRKKVRVAGQTGLVIIFREGDEVSGNKWRIRLGLNGDEKGCMVFNIAHADFTAAEQKGDMALRQYMSYLVTVVLAQVFMSAEEAQTFHRCSEDYMLQFLDAFLVKPGA